MLHTEILILLSDGKLEPLFSLGTSVVNKMSAKAYPFCSTLSKFNDYFLLLSMKINNRNKLILICKRAFSHIIECVT